MRYLLFLKILRWVRKQTYPTQLIFWYWLYFYNKRKYIKKGIPITFTLSLYLSYAK